MRSVPPARFRLTPTELLWTIPVGAAEGVGPLLDRPRGTLRSAMEDDVLAALLRPPCVVSFSGGRDSSTVLAVATAVARREGLALPVPVTNTFPDVAASHETPWQELVVRHLGLPDWTRLTFTDELDVGGAIARSVLADLGVCAPFNLHFHEPVVRLATGGSVLTGVGGDELFVPVERPTPYRLLSRRWPPTRANLRSAVADLAPRRVQVGRQLRRMQLPFRWVRPAAAQALRHQLAVRGASEPMSWERAVRTHVWPGRRTQMHREGLARLGARHDVVVVSPFTSPHVLATTATAWGRWGPRGRRAELQTHFGDLVPGDLLRRTTKSTFNGAFWAGPAREWARGWSGAGIDEDLVDVEALRAEWASPEPDPHSFSLLHQALSAAAASPPAHG